MKLLHVCHDGALLRVKHVPLHLEPVQPRPALGMQLLDALLPLLRTHRFCVSYVCVCVIAWVHSFIRA